MYSPYILMLVMLVLSSPTAGMGSLMFGSGYSLTEA